MLKLNFDIDKFRKLTLFKKSVLIKQGYTPSETALKEFYKILFDPLKGAHKSFGEDRSLVKVMHQGKAVAPLTWSHKFPEDEGHYRDVTALKKAIELKSSVIFDEYYRYSNDAKELVAFIQEQLNCTSGCNAYLSQKDGVALPVHRDAHHVLVFALSGQKKWTVYNTKQDMYEAHNRIDSDLSDEEVINAGTYLNEIMLPGDVLYIPIGQFHSVENLINNALHLTVSMSFRPLVSILEDFLLAIYNPYSHETYCSTRVKNILNKIHPVYQQETVLGHQEILAGISDLFEAIKDFVAQDSFITIQNEVKKNNHLKVFTTPTDEFIEDMSICSE